MIDGFAIAGYRSFGEELTYIPDLSKVNIFIGKNNSGKSNILRFCIHLSQIKLDSEYQGFSPLDYCQDIDKQKIHFAIQVKKDSKFTGEAYRGFEQIVPEMIHTVNNWDQNIWLKYSVEHLVERRERGLGHSELCERIEKTYDDAKLGEIVKNLQRPVHGDYREKIKSLAVYLSDIPKLSFEAHLFPDFREIKDEGKSSASYVIDGKGLIEELKDLSAPEALEYREKTDKFKKINEFLQELIGEQEVDLQLPQRKNEINVLIKGKLLPLSNLGTGIHELILLASKVTIIENSIVCIEEPEIHIHPDLQKKFVKYIQKNTNNQYFITTHSNAFFDIPGVNIYHCKLSDAFTKCQLLITDTEKWEVLNDLGYKPSDILQANYVIWVEGPSDRIFINHWIKNKDLSLKEGINYIIMFYGGRLLSHLSYDSKEVSDFIRLAKLNRNASIVIDSDKKSEDDGINETKNRIIDDFNENHCFSWVTSGRTIENYFTQKLIKENVSAVHPKLNTDFEWSKFTVFPKLNDKYSIDKVALAREIVKNNPDFEILDLNSKITTLIDYIRKAN